MRNQWLPELLKKSRPFWSIIVSVIWGPGWRKGSFFVWIEYIRSEIQRNCSLSAHFSGNIPEELPALPLDIFCAWIGAEWDRASFPRSAAVSFPRTERGGGLLRCVPFKNDSPYVSVFNSRISLLMLGCDSVWEGGLEADLNGSFCKKVVHNEESGGGRSRWEIRRWGVALKPTLHPWEPPLVLLSPLGAASRAVQKIKCLLNMKWHYYIVLVMKGGFYYHMCIIVICAFLPSPHRVLRHISNIICWI